jgi:transketolase
MKQEFSIVEAFGAALSEEGDINDKIVVFDADLSHATKSAMFGDKYRERFFNMGISEQDMISTAGGMASTGKIPFVCSFAVFITGNAYAQIRLAAIAGINIKIIGTHAGIRTGEDGATHQALEDIALMRALPGMTIVQPADAIETAQAVKAMAQHKGPCYMRLCRGELPNIHNKDYKFEIGKGEIVSEGKDITIIATGALVIDAIRAAGILVKHGIDAEVINISTIKPIDSELILKSARKTRQVIVCEDHNTIGGLGSAVEKVVCRWLPCQVDKIGVPDAFGESGSSTDLYKKYELTSEAISATLRCNGAF